jgi:hypothetical protein
MATDEKKEAFLDRWSRLKREQKDLPAKESVEQPSVDKLTPESDFSGFMHPKVQDALRRAALKKLFNDPHFQQADLFEPFSGDWTVGEPISEEMLATLNQAQQLLFSDQQKEQEQETQVAKDESPAAEETPKADEPGKQDA